jgi:hypothetical protein
VNFRSSKRPRGGSSEAAPDGNRVRHEEQANRAAPHDSDDDFEDPQDLEEGRRQRILFKGKSGRNFFTKSTKKKE